MFIEGLALGSAFLDAVSSIIITPVAKQGMAIRLLAVRSGFAALFISAGLFLLSPEIGFGTITSFGVGVVLLSRGQRSRWVRSYTIVGFGRLAWPERTRW